MAELGRLLMYEASRDWLVSCYIMHRINNYCYYVMAFFVFFLIIQDSIGHI